MKGLLGFSKDHFMREQPSEERRYYSLALIDRESIMCRWSLGS